MAVTAYDAAVLALNPQSYWKLDEASGNFADSVGGQTLTARGSGGSYPDYQEATGYVGVGDGVAFGVTSAQAVNGWAIKTSAISQLVTNKMSVVGWFNLIGFGNPGTPLICASYNGGHTDPYYTFFLGPNGSGNWRVAFATTGTFLPANGNALPASGWKHIGWTWDGSNSYIYVDGAIDSTIVYNGASVFTMGSFAINCIPALDLYNYAPGTSASRVAYWNDTTISAPQIAALYATRNSLPSSGAVLPTSRRRSRGTSW
jgi:hypothetical protein